MIKASCLALVLAAAISLPPMLKADDAAKPAEKAMADAKASTLAAKAAPKAAVKAAPVGVLKAANNLMDAGKLDEAIKAYEAMGELKSKKAETWRLNNWGLCLIKQEKFTDAIPMLEKSVAVDANNDIALRNLGACYERTDQLDKAIETYKKAVDAAKATNGDASKAENNLKVAQAKQAGTGAADKKEGTDAKPAPKKKGAAPKADAPKDVTPKAEAAAK